MPSVAAAFGLRPAYHPAGVLRTTMTRISSGYASSIYEFGPVKIGTNGYLEAAAAGDRFVGTFLGCQFTASGKKFYSPYWPAGTVSDDAVGFHTRDPDIVYQIQSTAAVNIGDRGVQGDLGSANSGSTATGLSSATFDVSSVTTGGNAGLRVLDVVLTEDNNWGDTYTNILVNISEHQDRADRAAY